MAKKDKSVQPLEAEGLAADLLNTMNQLSTSTKAYVLGDHAEHTWGIPIPNLAFQWVIGGSNVFPCQRYLSISGPPKSFKSTLAVQLGVWHVQAGGIYVPIDNESKTSATMLEAMTWWCLDEAQQRRILFKETKSVEEWQKIATGIIEKAQKDPERPKGARVPIYLAVDSLMGTAAEEAQEALMKEGHAEARGYPLEVMAVTNWFKRISLTGTTMSVGYVRQLKEAMNAGHGGPQFKETGGAQAAFACSLSLRVTKSQTPDSFATHAALPHPNIPGEGYTLWLKSDLSCLGPDKRTLAVDVIWQYVDQEYTDEAGEKRNRRRQIMVYDWAGALGRLLFQTKYDDKKKGYTAEIDQLNEALFFSQAKHNRIKCEKLGLECATFTEFGLAIEANPEVRQRISDYLNISQYRTVQEADIDKLAPKAAD